MELAFDPGQGEAFWKSIYPIEGYPHGEERPIREMVFESGALFELPQLLTQVGADRSQPLLIVMDEAVMRRGSDELKPLLLGMLRRDGWNIAPLVMQPDATGQVHTDMPHVDAVKAQLRKGAAVLSVGSGTITDVAKHGCFTYEQGSGYRAPFVVFQTANSVSAYTSNMAPTFVEGVKRTLPSRYPDAVVCDLETLRDAPYEMTVAGVGDLLAAFVSLPDWRLARVLGVDPSYARLPEALMGSLDEIFLESANAIRSRSLDGMALLAKLIALGGLAMSLSHATTPLSGLEHVTSHVLDLEAELAHRPLAAHGSQVALATVIAAEVYQEFLNGFEPAQVDVDRCYPSPETMRERVLAAFRQIDPSGKAGEECWSDYAVKLAAWHAHRGEFEAFLKNWPAVRTALEKMTQPAERVLQILRAVGAPLAFDQLEPPIEEPQVKFAFMNAPLMRRRLTLGDLLVWLDWDRESVWQRGWGRLVSRGGYHLPLSST